MNPIGFSITNPVKISVGVILLIMAGLLALGAIPIQLTPNVDQPVVSITTMWEGASPAEIESDIVREQEDKLKTIEGLTKMSSVSQQGQAQITLEFPVTMNKNDALREVSEKLRQVPDYPDNVDEPVVEASDPRNRDYIAWIILSTEDPDYDVRQLQKWAEDNIETSLERIVGVSEVNVLGGAEPEVQVQVDPRRMAQLGIEPGQLVSALRTQNVNISAGEIPEGKFDTRVRAVGEYERTDQIEQTIVSQSGEPVVRVRDIGEVVLTYKEPDAIVRSRGERALAINAQREVGSNVMQVMNAFRAEIQNLNDTIITQKGKELGLSVPLTLEQVYDQTVYITQAIALVRNNLFVGGTLAIISLLLFLRSIRATVVIGLAIPISIIGTFVVMVVMGRNLNVISLAGLAFAVGMVVDNAIVVLENIDRHLGMGKTARQAAYDGAREVWGAILASTLTTLAVFIPVLTIQEEAGQLFRDISLAICAAVTLSLIVSVMVIPTAAGRFLRQKAVDSGKGAGHAAGAVVQKFADLIYWLMGTYVLRTVIVVALAGLAILGSYLLMPPTSYLPSGNRNLVFAALIPPPGYNLEKQEQIGLRVESVVGPYFRAEPGSEAAEQLPPAIARDPETGETYPVQVPPLDNFFFVGMKRGLMFMGGISSDETRVQPVATLLNNVTQQQPGLYGGAQQLPLIRTSGSTGNGIELEISGPDLQEISDIAMAVFQQAMGRKEFERVQPDPGNFNVPAEEVQVETDLVRARELGLTHSDVGLMTQILGDGAIIDDYPYEGDTIDLKVISRFSDPGSAEYIADMPIATPRNRVVPLNAVATIRRTVAPQQINRIGGQKSITIEITLGDAVALDTATQIVRQEIIEPMRESGQIPDYVQTSVSGTAAKLQQVQGALLGTWTGFNVESLLSLLQSRAFLALVVIFLLMAALFESWFYPAVIMFTVPLATIGGFAGLAIVHSIVPTQQLDVLTMLGFVILIGIVVNNAILIVHQALNFMRGEADSKHAHHENVEPRRAIAESVRTRVRPILMSTMTSVGGMLPLVLFPGSGSELYRGLGSVVVGGLLVSSLFTLVLTPLVMSMVFDLRAMLGMALDRKEDADEQPLPA